MRVNRTDLRALFLPLVIASALVMSALAGNALADGPGPAASTSDTSVTVPAAARTAELDELKQQLKSALTRMDELQRSFDSGQARAGFQQQLNDQRARLESLEKELDAIPAGPPPAPASPAADQTGHGKEATPGITSGLAPADIYNDGFFVTSADKSFSVFLNGLFQIRFTGFKPQENVARFGASTQGSANFDVFLGRFATSGTVFSPTLKYFLQFQGSTAGNGNAISLLDWFTAKTFSKYLTLQAGRSWTPYSYEYYDNPGNYLLPDLSTAEYAFVLPRAIGAQAYGQAGRFSYAGMIANSIPALDAPGQENFNNKVSYIGHFQYDILAPYGYVETDPDTLGGAKPALTFWASVAYNPVSGSSSMENVMAGDRTTNATSTIGFREGLFTLQTTGYFRQTHRAATLPDFNSWGYGQQAGYYILPGKLELAERLSGVNWGAPNFPAAGSLVNTWYSGPNFPYHRINENSLGINYYMHGHHAKLQVAYSYLHGNTFTGSKFGGNRVQAQTQLMF